MSEITDGLDRRYAVQMQLSRLRHVKWMEETERQHQREKLRRQHYERFRWFYWGAGVIAFLAIIAGWGLLINDFLKVLSQPKTVVIRMPPPAPPDAAPTKP